MPEPYDASDPAQVKERATKSRLREKDSKDMLAAVLQHPQGRQWFWDLLTLCGVFSAKLPNNALHLAFAEGQRNIGLMLMSAAMEASPNFYMEMIKENQDG